MMNNNNNNNNNNNSFLTESDVSNGNVSINTAVMEMMNGNEGSLKAQKPMEDAEVIVMPVVVEADTNSNEETFGQALGTEPAYQPLDGEHVYPQVAKFKRARKINQKVALGLGVTFGVVLFFPAGVPLAVTMGVLNGWAFHGITKSSGRAQQYRLQKDLETEDRLRRMEAMLNERNKGNTQAQGTVY